MGRSTKKGPYVDVKLLRKIQRQESAGLHEPIRTWARKCTVVPEFVGHTFNVHNGHTFIRVFITEDMVGHKLGEFSPTRIFRGHSGAGSAKEREAAAEREAAGPPRRAAASPEGPTSAG